MDEVTLRAWIRGTLPPARRREVTVWMLRCKDPHLPALMEAFTREYEEEKADQRLLERVPSAGVVVEAWRWLLDAGRATWTAGDGAPALAVLSSAEAGWEEGLVVTASADGTLALGIRMLAEADVVLFATDDAEVGGTLLLQERLGGGTWSEVAGWQAEPGDGRTTFWLFAAEGPLPSVLADCLAAAREDRARVWAKRWEAEG